jgi:hypothetical protein
MCLKDWSLNFNPVEYKEKVSDMNYNEKFYGQNDLTILSAN